jgi:hypothetical protein
VWAVELEITKSVPAQPLTLCDTLFHFRKATFLLSFRKAPVPVSTLKIGL